MRTKITQLNERKNILEQYVSGADNNWHDEVKQAFFSAHVSPLRQNFSNQVSAMNEITTVLEQAEKEIKSLM